MVNAVVKLPNRAGYVTFFEGAGSEDPEEEWQVSNRSIETRIFLRIMDVIADADQFELYALHGRGERAYNLAAVFAQAVGGRVIWPGEPPEPGPICGAEVEERRRRAAGGSAAGPRGRVRG